MTPKLGKSKAELRTKFQAEAVASWDDYQNTGLHLTAEEADEWMAKLEAGEDAPIPKCHV